MTILLAHLRLIPFPLYNIYYVTRLVSLWKLSRLYKKHGLMSLAIIWDDTILRLSCPEPNTRCDSKPNPTPTKPMQKCLGYPSYPDASKHPDFFSPMARLYPIDSWYQTRFRTFRVSLICMLCATKPKRPFFCLAWAAPLYPKRITKCPRCL